MFILFILLSPLARGLAPGTKLQNPMNSKVFGLAWGLDTCKSVDVGPFIFHFLDFQYFLHFLIFLIFLFFSTQESAFLSSEKSILIFINECSPPLLYSGSWLLG